MELTSFDADSEIGQARLACGMDASLGGSDLPGGDEESRFGVGRMAEKIRSERDGIGDLGQFQGRKWRGRIPIEKAIHGDPSLVAPAVLGGELGGAAGAFSLKPEGFQLRACRG